MVAQVRHQLRASHHGESHEIERGIFPSASQAGIDRVGPLMDNPVQCSADRVLAADSADIRRHGAMGDMADPRAIERA